MAFVAGQLVELHSLDSDLNGVQAQLIRYDRTAKKWIAATFHGKIITVEEMYLQSIPGMDVDLVMGPRSDSVIAGTTLSESLLSKGFATVKLLASADDAAGMLETAKRLDATGKLQRLPMNFERGYLGLDSRAKACEISMDDEDLPEFVKASPLKAVEENFEILGEMLSQSRESLGFEIYSRTGLLMRMPLTAQEESRYPAEEVGDDDAQDFLKLMYRKRITAMHFVGPAAGTVKLFPSPEMRATTSEMEIAVEPHTMILFLSKSWEVSYESFGQSLTLQTFFLEEPLELNILEAEADPESRPAIPGILPPERQFSVVGAYCRYGINSRGTDQYFLSMCKAAGDAVIEMPLSRWDHSLYYNPESDGSDHTVYCRHACFGIEDAYLFDNKFFDISSIEAQAMDPMQRQIMEVSFSALSDGGYDKNTLSRKSECIGHFVGCDKSDYREVINSNNLKLPGALSGLAMAFSIFANRFSYTFNLKGPSMQIDTACSSSLVCTHMSKLCLMDNTQDVEPAVASVVNGINLNLHVCSFQFTCAASMLSRMGRCFTFDKSADGYTRGEACGALCIKPQQFNPAEGSIALLAGSNVNQDGRSASLTAPNGPSQTSSIRAVMRECGISPGEVDAAECHGTGTSLGDPIEIGSIRKVMAGAPRNEPLLITTSKSMLAHGEGSAGLAGFMKCVVQVSRAEIGPNNHLRSLNPHIDMDGFDAVMVTESSLAARHDSAQIGVSSYGFGGTNAHAEAWGRNIYTSRGASCIDHNKDAKKILSMPMIPQVVIKGDDFRNWETSQPHPGKVSQSYKMEADTNGKVVIEPVDEDLEDWGEDFALRGTWNDWQVEPLEAHESIDGLWVGKATIGQSGVERFQIIADEDEEKIYYPATERCGSMATEIWGPDCQEVTGRAWLLKGKPGAEFRIEFFQRKARKSVFWLAV